MHAPNHLTLDYGYVEARGPPRKGVLAEVNDGDMFITVGSEHVNLDNPDDINVSLQLDDGCDGVALKAFTKVLCDGRCSTLPFAAITAMGACVLHDGMSLKYDYRTSSWLIGFPDTNDWWPWNPNEDLVEQSDRVYADWVRKLQTSP